MMGTETTVPIGPTVRKAIDRILMERPGIGSAPLFPTPVDNTRPITLHLPVQDVARAGGWKCHAVVQDIYTQADDETILQVVLDHGQLREAR